MSVVALPRILMAETKGEVLKMVRVPAYVIPTLMFPAMFYLIFGISFDRSSASGGMPGAATYMIATYGAFGVIGAAMFGLGVGVAMERAQGWLTLKRASPMPPIAYFGAKVILSMIFAGVILALLGTMGVLLGDVRLPLTSWLLLLAALTLGAIPFCALGCAIAYTVGPNSSPAIVNLIYLPMSFASGLWVPIEAMPGFIRDMAPFMPAYHLGRISLATIGLNSAPLLPNVAVLAAYTGVFLTLAVILYRRDDGKTYG